MTSFPPGLTSGGFSMLFSYRFDIVVLYDVSKKAALTDFKGEDYTRGNLASDCTDLYQNISRGCLTSNQLTFPISISNKN